MEQSANKGVQYNRIVCDNGSGYIKLGYGGDNIPRYTIPSILGRPMLRANQKIGNIVLKDLMIGDEVTPCRAALEITYPLHEGKIKNWDDMQLLWEYCFDQVLKLPEDKSELKILLTEPARNPEQNRIKSANMMFEKFGFGGVMFKTQAVLTLMAEGLETGAVLDSGDGVTHCIPVCQGFIQESCVKRLNVAGSHVTNHLIKLLLLRGYAFNSSADFELVREIKEKMCYVSINLAKERKLAMETTVLDKEYKLPDGQTIIIGRERFEAPEILNNPMLIENENDDMATMIYKSICECDMSNQKELFANVWLSGGTTMIPGMSSRLEQELRKTLVEKKGKGDAAILKRVPVVVHDPPRRKNYVFMGGSYLANFAQDDFYITKQEYQESGSKILFSKI